MSSSWHEPSYLPPPCSPSPHQPSPTPLKVRPLQETLPGPGGMTKKKREGIPWQRGLGGKGEGLRACGRWSDNKGDSVGPGSTGARPGKLSSLGPQGKAVPLFLRCWEGRHRSGKRPGGDHPHDGPIPQGRAVPGDGCKARGYQRQDGPWLETRMPPHHPPALTYRATMEKGLGWVDSPGSTAGKPRTGEAE